VAYLPIDPRDLGRNYQEVIRINSQSGKGGVAYVLQEEHGLKMPRWLQVDFSPVVQAEAENTAAEVSAEQIFSLFEKTYLYPPGAMELGGYQVTRASGEDSMTASLLDQGSEITIQGSGRGVLEAFVSGLSQYLGQTLVIIDYNEHTLGSDEGSEAMAYVQISIGQQRVCGAGKSRDMLGATLNALLNAVARSNSEAARRAA
jgi:2-isopropylmalate synthase